jgi:hypothetical protein
LFEREGGFSHTLANNNIKTRQLRAYTFDNSVSEALRCEEVAIDSRVTNGKWDQFLISLALHFSVGEVVWVWLRI